MDRAELAAADQLRQQRPGATRIVSSARGFRILIMPSLPLRETDMREMPAVISPWVASCSSESSPEAEGERNTSGKTGGHHHHHATKKKVNASWSAAAAAAPASALDDGDACDGRRYSTPEREEEAAAAAAMQVVATAAPPPPGGGSGEQPQQQRTVMVPWLDLERVAALRLGEAAVWRPAPHVCLAKPKVRTPPRSAAVISSSKLQASLVVGPAGRSFSSSNPRSSSLFLLAFPSLFFHLLPPGAGRA